MSNECDVAMTYGVSVGLDVIVSTSYAGAAQYDSMHGLLSRMAIDQQCHFPKGDLEATAG